MCSTSGVRLPIVSRCGPAPGLAAHCGSSIRSPHGRRPNGQRIWYNAAGGGDALPLAHYVLTAIDADPDQLAEAIRAAHAAHDVEIEVLALLAMARLLTERGDEAGARATLSDADTAMSGARHLLADADHVDRLGIQSHLDR